MKTKTLLTTLLLAGLFAVSSTAMAAEITTDKGDYAPGEVALIAGSGFYPGELIDLSISIDDPASGGHIGDWDWTEGYADEYGEFLTGYLVPDEALGMTLTATAMGDTSALIAVVTFTDDNPHSFVKFATSDLPSGVSITINYTRVNPAGNTNSDTSTLTSPGPTSGNGIQTKPGTTFTYSGFPASVFVDPDTYELDSISPVSGFLTGSAGDTTTVIATYKKKSTTPCPTNTAPTISASDLDLGEVVGCLVDGSFQRTVTIAPSDFSPVTSDPDGDPVTVTLNVSSVILVGPGAAEVEVTLTATDDPSARNVSGCPALVAMSTTTTVKVKASIVYAFVGFLPPLDNNVATKVKRGSTVPVKFQLFDCEGTPITTGHHEIDVVFTSGNAPAGDLDVANAGQSADDGFCFRYSAPNWIFNLKTNTSYGLGCTYTISAYLDDGTKHDVTISIK